MTRYLITFPSELRQEIEKSLKESVENAKDLEKSKKVKFLGWILSRLSKVKLEKKTFCDYKFIDDNKVIWDYTIVGEDFMNKEKLAEVLEKRLQKDFKTDKIKVEILE